MHHYMHHFSGAGVLGLGRVEKGETREERAIIFIVLLAALLAEMKLLIDNL